MVILVVEDNPTTQRAIQVILEDLGYITDYAGNGYGALTRMSVHTPRVIIADYLMPAMNGLEFAKRVRNNPAWVNIPIIFTTALAMDELPGLKAQLDQLGPVTFLHKPFNPDELIDIILRLRSEHPSWPVPPPRTVTPPDLSEGPETPETTQSGRS